MPSRGSKKKADNGSSPKLTDPNGSGYVVAASKVFPSRMDLMQILEERTSAEKFPRMEKRPGLILVLPARSEAKAHKTITKTPIINKSMI